MGDRPDSVPEDMPIPKAPIDMEIIADVADQREIDVGQLVEALENIHAHVTERARDLTERYIEEFGYEALVFQADIQQHLYVDPGEWDELGEELGLDPGVASAAKKVHNRQSDLYDDRLDEYERDPALGTNDILVMATPAVQDWIDAGLSRRQAYVQTLRAKGDTQKRIAQKIGIAIGTVKSHCDRVDRKIDQARQLVRLAEEHDSL